MRRLLGLLVAALLAVAGTVVNPLPASACACGAAIPNPESTARVTGETALVWWDGATEQIDMVLALSGTATDTAWIMPSPPNTQLGLGSSASFRSLNLAIQPRVVEVRKWRLGLLFRGMAASPPDRSGGGTQAPGVSVQQTQVGPFTVSTLSATDAHDVNTWLKDHGFGPRDDLVPAFQSYLDQGWQIQAAKLTAVNGTALQTDLPPLRMTFATTKPVYPIRLSSLAKVSQDVTLYLAAPHELAITTQAAPALPLTRVFAGRVPAAWAGRSTGPGGGSSVYLTAYQGTLTPTAITADYAFATTTDQPYQRTVEVVHYRTIYIEPLIGLAMVLGLLLALVLTLAAVRRR